ncbi:hypothetical protein [Bradyrhizobium sp. CCBAU 53415]|uniref:hypothetical protein n=1 Tax=Bradyrhizobium sp. CCBAU 53415 TaxID=1325119 RepID=UPI002306D479|nr:hypothetical protein [Bradyrhizobium sp. CCBAU 53415]MDA9464498.1 hypothetical protein [Bradyrhizobium sp. CCBAU 53415]
MSSVLEFCQPRHAKKTSHSRQTLPEFLASVATLLSQVQALDIQTTDDVRQAIFILELANSCIRLLIQQTKLDEATRTSLLAEAAMIDLRIAEARRDTAHLFGENDLKLRIAAHGEQPKGAPCSF